MNIELLRLKQLDEQLKSWDAVKQQLQPQKGWVNLTRTVLGLSSRKLAKRMQVNQSRIIQIEEAERNKVITIKTLEKAAEAMGCKFVYGLIPNTSLHDILEQQAQKLAKTRLTRVSHSMELEAQGVNAKKQQQQIDELTKKLLEDKPKKLWSEEG